MRFPSLRTLLFLPLLGGVVAAQEQETRWSLGLGVGRTIPLDSAGPTASDIVFDDGFALSGFLRRELGAFGGHDRFRLAGELELFHMDNEIDEDNLLAVGSSRLEDTSTVAVMLNGRVEASMTQRVSWYGSLGVGYAAAIDVDSFADVANQYTAAEDDGIAWQGKLGIEYRLGSALSWAIGYRYFQTEDVELVDFASSVPRFDLENRAHVLEVGVRWRL